jgi:hypothetical protein
VVTELLRRGALGILWVTADESAIRSQIQLADAAKSYLQNPTLPIFRVSTAVADTLLAPENTTTKQLIVAKTKASQTGAGWFAHDLTTQANMVLQLNASQEIEVAHVMGFFPGYDDDLAEELVIVFAAYDGLGQEADSAIVPVSHDGTASVGLMLEMARLWEANNLDPRRSVLFIAWGGGQLDESGALVFLEDNDHFRKLAARVNTPPLTPALLFQLDTLDAAESVILIDPASDEGLQNLWQDSARTTDLGVGYGRSANPGLITETIPTLALHGSETPAQTDADRLTQVGQTLTLSLIKILRQVNY